MLYHYLAQDVSGHIKEGNVSQPNTQAVLDFLTSQNLKPISIQPLITQEKKGIFSFGKKGLSITDKVFLTKYLSLMLRVGTDLFSAIDILIEDYDKGPVRNFLFEIRQNLEQGKPFYLAFEKHPESFSPVVANLIRAGETAGNLESTLNDVSLSLDRDRELQSKIKSSLIYPIILIVGSIAMVIFLVTFAIPKLGEMFLSTDQKIPAYSKAVLTIGMFLNDHIKIVIALLITIPLLLYLFFTKTKQGKKFYNAILEKIPVTRNLTEKMALERFASVFGSLIKAGMPIIQAVEITAKATGNPKYEEALIRIAKEGLTKGVSIGDSFKKEKVFPAIVSNLLAIGEKAGHTEEILQTLSTFYLSEIDVSLKTLVAFIEPALLVFIGVMIGGIALSLIVPIYQLIGQF